MAKLEIDKSHYVDLGKKGYEISNANLVVASETTQIEYQPWMRHHRVAINGRVLMIHETWCSWTPV